MFSVGGCPAVHRRQSLGEQRVKQAAAGGKWPRLHLVAASYLLVYPGGDAVLVDKWKADKGLTAAATGCIIE